MCRELAEWLITHQRSSPNDRPYRPVFQGLDDPVVEDPPKDWSVRDPILQQNLQPRLECLRRCALNRFQAFRVACGHF